MSKDQKKLFLLDAMALIYRAHFAFSKNPRINSKGVNTSAAFGFTNALFEVITKEKPTHLAVAFDVSGPTFRHAQYQAYKANRQEQPEDIQIAIPVVKEIVKAFGIPVLEMQGFEADDIIGTIAKKASCEEFTVYMMTPDKDYAQLVEDCVFLYKPAFMGNAVDILGVPEVLKKFDIDHVDQVRDLLGLQGDSVDNIPGIPGIGPKTASKLLKEFGSLENIIANADQLKGKQKERVIEFSEQGIMSKELATIKIDVPIDFDAETFRYDGPDDDELRRVFLELEFRALTRRVLGEPADEGSDGGQTSLFEQAAQQTAEQPVDLKNITEVAHNYQLVDTPKKRKALVQQLEVQELFCFDTETDSLDALTTQLVGLAFSFEKGSAYYVPCPTDQEETKAIVQEFKALLEDDRKTKIAQNLKFDLLVLKKYGIEVKGPSFDTMIAHYLLDPETSHGMDVMAQNYLQYKPVSIESLIGKKGKNQGSMRDLPPEDIVEYAGEDADITLQLQKTFAKEIQKDEKLQKLFYEMELPLVPVLAAMEYEGVKIDTSALEELSAELAGSLLEIEQDIFRIAGAEFNIGSPKQLGEVLFDNMKLVDKPKKTKSGQYATGENILSALATEHDIARRILDFRELMKLKNTYVDALPRLISDYDGRIHTSYNQAVTSTGRLSSTNPNLQNIPIRTKKGQLIRKAFVPRSEHFLLMAADYSQVELRIMASFSKDESMIDAFHHGRDIHATTAAKIYGVALEEVTPELRRKAKTANFGIIYGVSAFGLAQQLSIPRQEASEIITAYFKEFPSIKNYMDEAIQQARKQEYVETVMGRRRYLRDINSRNPTVRGYAERNAINAPIQGTAADMIKIAMVNIHRWMQQEKLQSRMIMQVHDELVFDVHQDEAEQVKDKIMELMKNALPLEVPMEVEANIAQNWLDAH